MHSTFFTVTKSLVVKRILILDVIAGIVIWSVIIPIALLHAWVFLYQEIYFSFYDIPKIRLENYVTYDRNKLKSLGLGQKIACAYCAYCNGVAAWVKAVINRTETYSCAIKHRTQIQGNEHQEDYLPYENFI